ACDDTVIDWHRYPSSFASENLRRKLADGWFIHWLSEFTKPLSFAALHLDRDPLNLVKRQLVSPTVIKLRRARAGMIRHCGRLLERSSVFQVGRDPGRPETVIAELRCDPGRHGAPADHRIGVRLRQHGARQLAGAA